MLNTVHERRKKVVCPRLSLLTEVEKVEEASLARLFPHHARLSLDSLALFFLPRGKFPKRGRRQKKNRRLWQMDSRLDSSSFSQSY